MITLRDYLAQIEIRKARRELRDTPASIEAMRNKGAARTLQKRELLRRVESRAKASGSETVASYY